MAAAFDAGSEICTPFRGESKQQACDVRVCEDKGEGLPDDLASAPGMSSISPVFSILRFTWNLNRSVTVGRRKRKTNNMLRCCFVVLLDGESIDVPVDSALVRVLTENHAGDLRDGRDPRNHRLNERERGRETDFADVVCLQFEFDLIIGFERIAASRAADLAQRQSFGLTVPTVDRQVDVTVRAGFVIGARVDQNCVGGFCKVRSMNPLALSVEDLPVFFGIADGRRSILAPCPTDC